jgi:hypothetical protein
MFIFSPLVVSLLVVGLTLSAQEEEEEISVIDCFNKAEMEGYYILTEEGSGEKITVTGLDDLERNSSNHGVTVMGTMEQEGDDAVLMATSIQHIAAI